MYGFLHGQRDGRHVAGGEHVLLEGLLPVELLAAFADVLLAEVDGGAVLATYLLLREGLFAVGTRVAGASVNHDGLHSAPVVRLQRTCTSLKLQEGKGVEMGAEETT